MMNNRQLADTFTLIANLSEIKGEIIYKTLAYRKAAENLTSLGREASEYWKEGKLEDIPGVGKAISEKIDELLSTGKLQFLEKLKKEVPAEPGGLVAGARAWPEEDRADLEDVEHHDPASIGKGRTRQGNCATCPAWAQSPKRRSSPASSRWRGVRGASRSDAPGRWPRRSSLPSKRWRALWQPSLPEVCARMRSTVGDLDILVASKKSAPVMEAFVHLPGVSRVLGKGETKSSIEFSDGVRAQVWVHPPEKFGTALVYATGSKDHNVRLRELALD